MKKIISLLLISPIIYSSFVVAGVPIPDIRASMIEFKRIHEFPKLDKSKLAIGRDQNFDGVRDDIGAYITGRDLTGEQREFLYQTAAVYQKMVEYGLSPNDNPVEIGYKYNLLMTCAGSIDESFDPAKEAEYLFAFTFNTDQRFEAFKKFDDDERSINPKYSIKCN